MILIPDPRLASVQQLVLSQAGRALLPAYPPMSISAVHFPLLHTCCDLLLAIERHAACTHCAGCFLQGGRAADAAVTVAAPAYATARRWGHVVSARQCLFDLDFVSDSL